MTLMTFFPKYLPTKCWTSSIEPNGIVRTPTPPTGAPPTATLTGSGAPVSGPVPSDTVATIGRTDDADTNGHVVRVVADYQAPAGDIAMYKDRFAEGWDVARERKHARLRRMGLVNCALALRLAESMLTFNAASSTRACTTFSLSAWISSRFVRPAATTGSGPGRARP